MVKVPSHDTICCSKGVHTLICTRSQQPPSKSRYWEIMYCSQDQKGKSKVVPRKTILGVLKTYILEYIALLKNTLSLEDWKAEGKEQRVWKGFIDCQRDPGRSANTGTRIFNPILKSYLLPLKRLPSILSPQTMNSDCLTKWKHFWRYTTWCVQ